MQVHQINLETEIKGSLFHLAIGNFDGVHLGHQKIIKELVKNANNHNKPSAILSFDPHPRQFFSRDLDRYKIFNQKKKNRYAKWIWSHRFFLLKI